MTQFCPHCNLVIAPAAKDKRLHRGIYFHASCLIKYLLRIDAQRRAGKELRARS